MNLVLSDIFKREWFHRASFCREYNCIWGGRIEVFAREMAVQHSFVQGQSQPSGEIALRQTVRDEFVRIAPEYLEAEDLRYELYLRNLPLSGTNRERTGRIATALQNERRENSHPGRSHCLLSVDVAQSVVRIAQARRWTEELPLDEHRIRKLGTLLAHLEARVGRMFPDTYDQGIVVRDLREEVDGSIRAFIDKVLELRRARVNNTDPVPSTLAQLPPTVSGSVAAKQKDGNSIEVTDASDSEGDERDRRTSQSAVTAPGSQAQTDKNPSLMAISTGASDGASLAHANSKNADGRSANYTIGSLPTEAMFSSWPPASTLTAEQLKALEKTFESNYDGKTFFEDWSHKERAHSTQHMTREDSVNESRSVRFNVSVNPPNREEVIREFADTPYAPNRSESLGSGIPVPYGRYSDASSRVSAGSGRSNRTAETYRSVDTTRSERNDGTGRLESPIRRQIGPERSGVPAPPVIDMRKGQATPLGEPNVGRQPVNETYVINRDTREAQGRTGQFVFVPDEMPNDVTQASTAGVAGRFVFIPYAEEDPWRVILNGTPRENGTAVSPVSQRRTEGGRVQHPILAAQQNRSPRMSMPPPERAAPPMVQLQYPRSRMLPIHDWKINFSGEDKLVSPIDLRINEFLYQIEVNKHARRISDEEMLGQISSLLTGTARTWYYAYYRTFQSWSHFVESMRRRFLSRFHELDALDEISQRKQGKIEPVMAYLNHMVMLFQTISQNVDEEYMVHVIQRNLLPDIQRAIGPWEPQSLAELERVLTASLPSRVHSTPEPERRPFFRRAVVPGVNEIGAANDDEEEVIQITEEEIMALLRRGKIAANTVNRGANTGRKDASTQALISISTGPASKTSEMACYNCNEKGHMSRECTKPRKLHCYLCKKEGVKSTECDCSKNSASCLNRQPEDPDSETGSQSTQ